MSIRPSSNERDDWRRAVGERLTRFARPSVGSRGWPSYWVFGAIGYIAGLLLTVGLALSLELPLSAVVALAVIPPTTLLVSIRVSNQLAGRTRIVFYEKALLSVLVTAGCFSLLGQPFALGMDLTTLGVGAFLACGRIGCFRVACCHGRRSRSGVRYGWEHASGGYPARWVGLPVFPIQLVDGAGSALAVAFGIVVLRGSGVPGAATAAYACGYGVLRSALEFLRGDDRRSYFFGASEAQWTAAATVTASAILLPNAWTVGCAGLLLVLVLVLVGSSRSGLAPALALFRPQHLAEVDDILARLRADGRAETTSAGLRLAFCSRSDGKLELLLSATESALSAATVAKLLRQWGRSWTICGVSQQGGEHRVTLEAEVTPEALMA